MRRTLLLLLFPLMAACKDEAPPPKPAPKVAVAQAANGVQDVKIIVSDMGYQPASVELTAGIKTRITFVQQTASHCMAQVQIPSQGVPKTDLPLGKETVVEFTPKESGTFPFTCGMEMMKGSLVVKPAS